VNYHHVLLVADQVVGDVLNGLDGAEGVSREGIPTSSSSAANTNGPRRRKWWAVYTKKYIFIYLKFKKSIITAQKQLLLFFVDFF
jgi:hypothetical protein